MIELRTKKPDEEPTETDIVSFCEGLDALAARCGIVSYVAYSVTPSGHILSFSDLTTLVAGQGAIRKRIDELKSKLNNTSTNEQRSED